MPQHCVEHLGDEAAPGLFGHQPGQGLIGDQRLVGRRDHEIPHRRVLEVAGDEIRQHFGENALDGRQQAEDGLEWQFHGLSVGGGEDGLVGGILSIAIELVRRDVLEATGAFLRGNGTAIEEDGVLLPALGFGGDLHADGIAILEVLRGAVE